MEASQGLEAMLGGTAASPAANYLLVVAQDMSRAATQQPPAAAAAAGNAGSTAAAAVAAAAAAGGSLGLVAVDAGSGDIAYGLASTDSSTAAAAASSSSSSSGQEGSSVMSLESVLLSLSPSDIVLCEPVSAATQQVIKSYLAGASKSCRLERLQQQQPPSKGQGTGSSAQPPAAAAAAGGYLDAKLMNDLVDFFGGGEVGEGGAAAAELSGAGSGDHTPAAAATAGCEGAAAVGVVTQQGSLQFILSLPQPVLSALAGCLAHLRPFGLCGVLACTSSYRPLAVAGVMNLEGPALRQLEVLEAGEGGGVRGEEWGRRGGGQGHKMGGPRG